MVEEGRCESCGTLHVLPLKRWRCRNDECRKVVCVRFALKGKRYGREGEVVHVRLDPRPSGSPVQRLCGILERIEDAVPPPPEAAGERQEGTSAVTPS